MLLCVGSHNASYIMLFFTSIMNPLNLDFMFFYTINWKRLQMVFYLSSYADQYHDLISPSFGCSPVTSRHRKSSASFLLANQARANLAWKSDLHIWFGISFLWFLTQPSTFIQAWKQQLRKHWLVYPQCLESNQGSASRQLRTALYLHYVVWRISAFWSACPCCCRC